MSKKTATNLIPTHADERLSLYGTSLVESRAKIGNLKGAQLPSIATQSFSLTASKGEGDGDTIVDIDLRLDFDYEDSKGEDPTVSIFATFRLAHRHPPLPPERLKEALEREVIGDVWPYWREFSQSLGLRMGLPALPVPPFDLSHLEQELPG